MKKFKLFIAILLFSLTGCEDYLDKAPEFGLNEEDVFQKYESARGYLDENYRLLVDIHNWNSQEILNYHIGSLSDESASVITEPNPSKSLLPLNAGQWLNQPTMGEVGWVKHSNPILSPVIARAFTAIRICNKVIANAESIPNLTEEQVNSLLGQAHFFRAWWYFQIIKRWGGMPIFDKVFQPTDDMDLPRLTYHESSEWLISDLNKAIELLPHTWIDAEFGRATKGSAYGLRSMAALYAASPLMKNGLNMIVDNGYDQEWAERAAQYAHEAIEYVKSGAGGHRYRLMDGDEYSEIFYQKEFASDEALWFKLDGNRRENRDFSASYLPKRFENGGNGNSAMNFVNPTQNIVEKFETITGYPINHPSSGFNPAKPYENRDPRFDYNILVPGEEWGIDKANKPIYFEIYNGGTDLNQLENTPASAGRMASGYMATKYIWPEANGYTREYGKYNLNTTYIRVSQLYLDYAEAMTAAYGPTADPKGYGMTAVEAINIIRNRVGMPDVQPEFTSSKEEFMERVRNERAVELMFEDHRWHDLRRWMIAEEVLAQPIRGIRATPKGKKPYKDFTYQEVVLTPEQRVFSSRNYWYPVAQSHVDNLYNFQQNPGW